MKYVYLEFGLEKVEDLFTMDQTDYCFLIDFLEYLNKTDLVGSIRRRKEGRN